MWSFLDFFGFFLLGLKLPYQPFLRVCVVYVGVVFKLLFDELIEFQFLQLLLGILLILVELFGVFVPEGISRNVQIWQEPVVELLIPNDFFIDQFNVLRRNEVVNNEIF